MPQEVKVGVWEGFFTGLLVILGFVVLLGASVTYSGFVLQQLWNWHGTYFFPQFIMSLPQAVGTASLLTVLRGMKAPEKDGKKKDTGMLLIAMTLVLIIGWVAEIAK